MLITKHILVLVSLFFPFAMAFANWELVPLDDKSDFNTNCEYRAELEHKVKTRFSSTLNKKVGYISNVSGVSVDAGILSDNKAIYRYDMPSGVPIKKCKVLRLEKRCMPPVAAKQKQDEVTDMPNMPNKFKFGKVMPEANYGLDDARYNE